MADGHSFNNISLSGRGGTNPGQLNVYSRGILCKKLGGGKAVEVDKCDIVGVNWMKVPRTNQLGIKTRDGLHYKFIGFRDQDVPSLTNLFQNMCGTVSESEKREEMDARLLYPNNFLVLHGERRNTDIDAVDAKTRTPC